MHDPDQRLEAEGQPPADDASAPPEADDLDRDGDGDEAAAPSRRRFRLAWRFDGTQAIKLAVVLSFLILLGAMVTQRFRRPKDKESAPQIASGKPSKGSGGKTSRKPSPPASTPADEDPSTVPRADPENLAQASPSPRVRAPVAKQAPASLEPQPATDLAEPPEEKLAAVTEDQSPTPEAPIPMLELVPPPSPAPQPSAASPPVAEASPAPASPTPVSGPDPLVMDEIAIKDAATTSIAAASTPAEALPPDPTPIPSPSPVSVAPAPPDRETRPASGSLGTLAATEAPAATTAAIATPAAGNAVAWIPLPSIRPRRDVQAAPPSRSDDGPEPALASAEGSRPTPDPDPTPAPQVRHIVQSGENYASIARDFYSSTRFGDALRAANGGKPARVGATIQVPMVEALDPAKIPAESDAPQIARSGTSDTDGDAPPTGGSGRRSRGVSPLLPIARQRPEPIPLDSEPERRPIHVVRPGETLRSIARDTLNDAHRDSEILDLNRPKITDGARLPEGLRLALPFDAETGRRLR